MKDPKKHTNAIRDKIDAYSPTEIPDFLAWDQMDEELLAGLAKAKKQARKKTKGWLLLTLVFSLLFFICFILYSSGFLFNHTFFHSTNTIHKHLTPIATESQDDHLQSKAKIDSTIRYVNRPTEPLQPFTPVQVKRAEGILAKDSSLVHSLQEEDNKDVLAKLLALHHQADQVLELSLSPIKHHIPLEVHISLPDSIILLNLPPQIEGESAPIRLWSLGLIGGINTFGHAYQWNRTQEQAPNNEETELIGWSAGMRVQRSIGKNWSLGSGIELERLRYRFDYDETSLGKLYRPNTIDTIFINIWSGDSTFAYTDSVDGTINRKIRHYNHHYTLNLPIILGYQFKMNPINLRLQAGFNFSFLRQTKGKSTLGDQKIIALENEGYFRNNFGLGVLTEGQVEYPFSDQWTIVGNLAFRKNLSNVIEKNPFLDQSKPWLSQFRIGIVKVL